MFKRKKRNWVVPAGVTPTDFDRRIIEFQDAGEIVPTRQLIKTPEQIEDIRRSGVVNTGVLDLVEREIRAGMSTAEIDRLGQAQGGHHDNHTIGIIEMDAHSRMRDNQFLVRKVLLATAAAALVAITALAIALGHVSKKDDYTAAVATGQGGGPTGVQIPYAGTPDTADTTASPTREYATGSPAATLHNTLLGEATALLRAVKQHEDTTKLDVEQEKARRLKRAQDLLHKMSQKMREVDTVARFVKRNERAMLRVASEKGIFRSTPQARTLIDSAITQLEKLKKTAGTEPAPTDTATTGEAAAQQTQ